MRVILANGCFDLLHPGHVAHLQEARSFGDYLIVALTMDQYVDKGPTRPVFKWEDRAELLRALRCVDQVAPSANGVDAILKWRPYAFVKGSDYYHTPFGEDIKGACKKVGAILMHTKSPKMSTSDTIRKVCGS